MIKQQIKTIKIKDLCLWTENPRDPMNPNDSDFDIIKKAINDEKLKWNLPKLVTEMGKHYDLSELPTVVEMDGKFIVFDGNRRIAVLKYLQNKNLYNKLGGGLFFKSEPKELREQEEIPCNLCTKETALTNIERKHINNGSWGPLEREYFLHIHRGHKKSLFLKFEEQTGGAISNHPKMNQRFVKDELLTKKKLEEVGISFDKNGELVSNIPPKEIKNVVEKIISVVEDTKIQTRGVNRGKLKETILQEHPEMQKTLQPFDDTKKKSVINIQDDTEEIKKPRKTPRTGAKKILFERTLVLESGDVNNLYCGILSVYNKHKDDEAVWPIIGMSLRLLLDVAARSHYKKISGAKKQNNDAIYKDFLAKAKKQMNDKKNINFLSLTNDWLSDKHSMDGMLSKYAHGNITTNMSDILSNSYIIADILEFYFKK